MTKDLLGKLKEVNKDYRKHKLKTGVELEYHATILFELGASSQKISKRLRHSRVSTTDNIYIHVKEEIKKSTADLFNQAVENTK